MPAGAEAGEGGAHGDGLAGADLVSDKRLLALVKAFLHAGVITTQHGVQEDTLMALPETPQWCSSKHPITAPTRHLPMIDVPPRWTSETRPRRPLNKTGLAGPGGGRGPQLVSFLLAAVRPEKVGGCDWPLGAGTGWAVAPCRRCCLPGGPYSARTHVPWCQR